VVAGWVAAWLRAKGGKEWLYKCRGVAPILVYLRREMVACEFG
jgi:hypothetical protein